MTVNQSPSDFTERSERRNMYRARFSILFGQSFTLCTKNVELMRLSVSVDQAPVCVEVVEHRLDELREVVVVLPAPVVPRVGIVEVHRPTVGWEETDRQALIHDLKSLSTFSFSVKPELTDSLSDEVDLVRDLQLRHLLLELLGQLLGGKAHGVDVVRPHAQRVRRRLHHLQRGAQAVVDVHHGQPRVGSQVTFKLARFDGIVEDLDGVVWSEEEGKH